MLKIAVNVRFLRGLVDLAPKLVEHREKQIRTVWVVLDGNSEVIA